MMWTTTFLHKEENLIREALIEAYTRVEKEYEKNNLIGVFVRGSQCYNLDTPSSDIDIIALVLPTMEHIVKKINISSHFEIENVGVCKVTDIRDWVRNISKGSIDELNIFSKNYLINGLYVEEVKKLNYISQFLAIRNESNFISSLLGQMKALEKRAFKIREDIAQSNKTVMRVYFCKMLVEKILTGMSVFFALDANEDERDFLLNIKFSDKILIEEKEKEIIKFMGELETICRNKPVNSKIDINIMPKEVERILSKIIRSGISGGKK